MKKRLKIALAGNPNSGKTTIFNGLTGGRQHTGNYPGVTVEKKEGSFEHGGVKVDITDLPGTYSLTAYSVDELVARDFVTKEKPDLVVDVLDASNLERNLYLAVQFMELGVPLLLVFNMSDIAEARGYTIDEKQLSTLLGLPIVRTVGNKGRGLDALKDAIVTYGSMDEGPMPTEVRYGRELENEIAQLGRRIGEDLEGFRPRWTALKLLEGDPEVISNVCGAGEAGIAVEGMAKAAGERVRHHFGDSPEIVIADQRYGFISGACQESVCSSVEMRHSSSDYIDHIVTSRVFGIPIFLGMMYLVFRLAFVVGEVPMVWIENLFAWVGQTLTAAWPAGSALMLRSLIVDGIIGGVGGVLVFVPTIAFLFMAIAALEDSGYMARAAFVMDAFMHRIGLHGKSFIPMVIGFGCTVPAIMATRTLESRRDRLTTMLILPLFSCGARLPIYTLFIGAFFSEELRTPMLMLIYLIGIVAALLLARLLRSTVFRGESEAFVMELPPYRMPTVSGLLQHTWDRVRLFIRKAGTIILAFSIVLWVLNSYPRPPESALADASPAQVAQVELSHSLAGRLGHALEPVMKPIGFDWRTTTAMIGAVAAKEIFVAQLGIVNALAEEDATSVTLRQTLQQQYSPLQAFCIMIFCLISVPCVATVAATRAESNSWGWALVQFGGLTLMAYGLTFVVYQSGRLLMAVL